MLHAITTSIIALNKEIVRILRLKFHLTAVWFIRFKTTHTRLYTNEQGIVCWPGTLELTIGTLAFEQWKTAVWLFVAVLSFSYRSTTCLRNLWLVGKGIIFVFVHFDTALHLFWFIQLILGIWFALVSQGSVFLLGLSLLYDLKFFLREKFEYLASVCDTGLRLCFVRLNLILSCKFQIFCTKKYQLSMIFQYNLVWCHRSIEQQNYREDIPLLYEIFGSLTTSWWRYSSQCDIITAR